MLFGGVRRIRDVVGWWGFEWQMLSQVGRAGWGVVQGKCEFATGGFRPAADGQGVYELGAIQSRECGAIQDSANS